MKRVAKWKVALAGALVIPSALWMWGQAQQATQATALDAVMPPGVALYAETRDLSALIRDWNASAEKAAWLKSANYSVFAQTRLYQRLEMAQTEFEAAAGFPPDFPFAISIAGSESAIGIYDIGKLEFLYVTRMPTAKALESALGRTRSSYEQRTVAGLTYHIRENRESQRTALFATAQGLLLLATREDLMAQALTLLATKQGTALRGEPWYRDVTAASKGKGEIRIAMNLPELLKSPQFRAYWIHRNASEIREFSAGIADVFREATGIREERVFLRAQAGESRVASEADVARVLALAPANAGFVRASAMPSKDELKSLLRDKIVSPQVEGPRDSYAPAAATYGQETGSEQDLESRIDQPPFVPEADQSQRLLDTWLAGANVRAVAQVQSATLMGDGVFVTTPVAVAMLGGSAWDEGAIRRAMPAAFVRVQGPIAIVSSTQAMLDAVAGRLNAAPAAPAGTLVAEYRHSQELPNYTKMMTLIDAARSPADAPPQEEGEEGRMPEFFSQNVASLGRVLNRYSRVRFTMRDEGARVPQTVTFLFAAR
jgi:hypothetical protein